MPETEIKAWLCSRCGKVTPKKGNKKPKNCSGCKSPYWDKARVRRRTKNKT